MIELPDIVPSSDHGAAVRIQLRLSGLGNEKRCLLVGNSLTHFNHMPHMLEKLLQAATGDNWVCSSITRGGATLAWHRKTNYAGQVLDTTPVFDVVVFQDQSRRPAKEPEASAEDFIYWSEKASATGAKVLFYQTWDILNEPPMIDTFRQTLKTANTSQQATIAPAGEIWAQMLNHTPADLLYREDGKHPKAPGSLITAAVLCQTLCGNLPETCPAGMLAGGYEEMQLPEGFWARLKAYCQTLL